MESRASSKNEFSSLELCFEWKFENNIIMLSCDLLLQYHWHRIYWIWILMWMHNIKPGSVGQVMILHLLLAFTLGEMLSAPYRWKAARWISSLIAPQNWIYPKLYFLPEPYLFSALLPWLSFFWCHFISSHSPTVKKPNLAFIIYVEIGLNDIKTNVNDINFLFLTLTVFATVTLFKEGVTLLCKF